MDDVTKYGPVDGDPITERKKFRMKQNVNLIQIKAPGTEEVVQKGENGEKQSQHQQRKIH